MAEKLKIKIHCIEELHEAHLAAINAGGAALKSWKHVWSHPWMKGEDQVCHISKDFAPLSFGFWLEDENGRPGITGGIIAHNVPGSTVDPLSFELVGKPGMHWSIHT